MSDGKQEFNTWILPLLAWHTHKYNILNRLCYAHIAWDMKLSAVALLFFLGVCSRYEHKAQALSDACQMIHDPQVSLYSASKTPDKQHTSSSKSENNNLISYQVGFLLRISPRTLEGKLQYTGKSSLLCKTRWAKASCIWMKMSATFLKSTLLLVWNPEGSIPPTKGSYDVFILEKAFLATCY